MPKFDPSQLKSKKFKPKKRRAWDLLDDERINFSYENETPPKGIDKEQTYNKHMSEPIIGASNSSSSTIDLKKTTTNKEAFPEEWQAIDISEAEDIGFSVNHLSQLFLKKENKLTPDEVQKSLNAFIFDIKENQKSFRTRPINVLMGILKGGSVYTPPKNYEDPIEQAIRENLERRKEAQRARQKLNEELKEIEYQDWRDALKKEQVEEIVGSIKGLKGTFLEKTLKSHFNEESWPMKQLG